jgi:hypothetical protein
MEQNRERLLRTLVKCSAARDACQPAGRLVAEWYRQQDHCSLEMVLQTLANVLATTEETCESI